MKSGHAARKELKDKVNRRLTYRDGAYCLVYTSVKGQQIVRELVDIEKRNTRDYHTIGKDGVFRLLLSRTDFPVLSERFHTIGHGWKLENRNEEVENASG